MLPTTMSSFPSPSTSRQWQCRDSDCPLRTRYPPDIRVAFAYTGVKRIALVSAEIVTVYETVPEIWVLDEIVIYQRLTRTPRASDRSGLS